MVTSLCTGSKILWRSEAAIIRSSSALFPIPLAAATFTSATSPLLLSMVPFVIFPWKEWNGSWNLDARKQITTLRIVQPRLYVFHTDLRRTYHLDRNRSQILNVEDHTPITPSVGIVAIIVELETNGIPLGHIMPLILNALHQKLSIV